MLGKASLHSKTLGEYSSRDHVIQKLHLLFPKPVSCPGLFCPFLQQDGSSSVMIQVINIYDRIKTMYSTYCAVSFIRIEHSSMLGKASLHSKTLGEYSSRDHVIDDRTTHSVVRTRRQSSTGGCGPQLIQMSKTRQYLDSEKNRVIDISCFMSKVYQP